MSSLKGYTPALAGHLGTSPVALYERQRELVRSGALEAGDGRGPGSGVRATSPSVAMLMIAVLATDSLSETGEMVGLLAKARTTSGVHPFKETKTLVDTLAFILTSKVWSSRIVQISIVRSQRIAVVQYRDGRKIKSVEFHPSAAAQASVLRIEAALPGAAFRAIANDVWEIVGENDSSRRPDKADSRRLDRSMDRSRRTRPEEKARQ